MKPSSFPELFREAERHLDYQVAGAILQFTESVVREMSRQGLTRSALADRLGTTPAYVTKILRGKANFTLATMVRLSKALGTDLQVHLNTSHDAKARPPVVKPIHAPVGRADRTRNVEMVEMVEVVEVVAVTARPAARETRHKPRSDRR